MDEQGVMSDSPLETDELAHWMDQKLNVLGQLRELARRQEEVVGAGEMSALMKLLAAKQTLIEVLTRCERGLDRFRPQDPESRRWRNPGDRARCAAKAARCGELLGEILVSERAAETTLARRRDQAASHLQGFQGQAQAQQAYRQAGSPVASRLEFKG